MEQLQSLRIQNELRPGDRLRQLELALVSPVMHAAQCEVRHLTTILAKTGESGLMQQALDLLNVVNEQLTGMLSEDWD